MSALRKAGSTSEWRRLRLTVFARDRDPVTGLLTCWRCGCTLTEHDPSLSTHATLGHKRERVLGGTDELDNLAPECAHDNRTEGAKLGTPRSITARLNLSRQW